MIPEKDVTVVIPVYNRRDLLVRCLDSVYAQTRRPARVIVVDNASTDDTRAVALQWAASHRSDRFRVDVFYEPAHGAPAARNRGLGEVDTEWVAFFDSDDTMRPCLMERAADVKEDADIIYWKMVRHKGTSCHISHFAKKDLVRTQMLHSLLSTQRYMVRTEFIRVAGGWGDFKVWNDWELGIRLLGNNPRMEGIPEVLVDVYAQTDSITGTSFYDKAGEWEAVTEAVGSLISADEDAPRPLRWSGATPEMMRGMVDYVRVVLAACYKREGHPETGRRFLKAALAKSRVSVFRKLLLRLIYWYTGQGGRGASLLWR